MSRVDISAMCYNSNHIGLSGRREPAVGIMLGWSTSSCLITPEVVSNDGRIAKSISIAPLIPVYYQDVATWAAILDYTSIIGPFKGDKGLVFQTIWSTKQPGELFC